MISHWFLCVQVRLLLKLMRSSVALIGVESEFQPCGFLYLFEKVMDTVKKLSSSLWKSMSSRSHLLTDSKGFYLGY